MSTIFIVKNQSESMYMSINKNNKSKRTDSIKSVGLIEYIQHTRYIRVNFKKFMDFMITIFILINFIQNDKIDKQVDQGCQVWFQIGSEPKCTETDPKYLRFVPFGDNLTLFGTKPDIHEVDSR